MKRLKSIIKSIIFYGLLIIIVVILTIGIFALIAAMQEGLFLPQEYLMWIFKYPTSRLVFIYELYLLLGFLYVLNKDFRGRVKKRSISLKKYRKPILSTFIIFNIILFYILISSVTVITNNKIIDYSFLYPQGKEYSYNDIVKIDTGVYGEEIYLPFTHSMGDFYYIIEFEDGTKIDLTEVGGVKNDEHEYFVIEKLDNQLVNMGIPKVSSMENFEYSAERLDKVYSDKIRSILENTN